MEVNQFEELLANSILEYAVWRHSHDYYGKLYYQYDSPFFYFRNKYPDNLFFPLNTNFVHDSLSEWQSHLIREIWNIIQDNPVNIIFFEGFSHPLLEYFITEVVTSTWDKKINLLDPEWSTPEQLDQLEQLLVRYPDNLFLHQAKFLYFYSKQRYQEACDQIQIIFSLDPDNSMYLCRYSRLMWEALFNNSRPNLENLDIALSSLFRAEEILWEDTKYITFVYAWIGLVYSKMRKYQESIVYLNKTIDLNEAVSAKILHPYFWKARSLFSLGRIEEAKSVMSFINTNFDITHLTATSSHMKPFFQRYHRFASELECIDNIPDMELQYAEMFLEECLYRRDDTPKNWGHIYGKTTVYSYRRWNKKTYFLPREFQDSAVENFEFSPSITYLDQEISLEKKTYIEKYHLMDFSQLMYVSIDPIDRDIFPLISLLIEWHQSHYLRSSLDMTLLDRYPLLWLIYTLSVEHDYEHNYYFPIFEYIDDTSEAYLLQCFKKLTHHLFINIALYSFYFQKWKFTLAEKFFYQALRIDPSNPWILWKFALLAQAKSNGIYAMKLIQKAVVLLPQDSWVYDVSAKILLDNKKYDEVIEQVNIYDTLTDGKYRTFEPYLWRAIALFEIGDINEAKENLKYIDNYYFWKWYQYMYEMILQKIAISES